jgi:hypothetical protein
VNIDAGCGQGGFERHTKGVLIEVALEFFGELLNGVDAVLSVVFGELASVAE